MGSAWCGGDKQLPGKSKDLKVRSAPICPNEEAPELEETIDWGQLRCRSIFDEPKRLPHFLKHDGIVCTAVDKGPPGKQSGVLGQCCAAPAPPELDAMERAVQCEEVIGPLHIRCATQARKAQDGSQAVEDSLGTRPRVRWQRWRPLLMGALMALTVILSSFAQSWLPVAEGAAAPGGPSFESALRYGSIPVIAAIIGYGTNVVALLMMFQPLEFVGCFPHLKIGCGLDLPLCGWQGVIPMKAVEMATISVDLMTQKLIKVEEIFQRLNPERVSEEVAEMLPEIVSAVITEAGRRHCPKLWEHMPTRVRKQLEEQVAAESKPMMARFIEDLQNNISDVFDLKACVVDVMVSDRRILNDTFLTCGAEEFEFIRISGFYLGFLFGILQMIVWMFVKDWWILPLCGVFVGYFTNVVALKVIFLPVEPRKLCGGLLTIQGLFLQRQPEVSALYAKQCAERILAAEVLMHALVSGPSSDKMFELVDKHVAACMEDQAGYYKPMFLMSIGSETWIDFRGGVCAEFRKKIPALLTKIQGYTQETLQLEDTLRDRLRSLPPAEFERLLHAVFEQDEIKLILVGAILGAVVGFFQAVGQTPEQLGFRF